MSIWVAIAIEIREGLKSIISLLNYDSNEIKKKATLVIGAAM
ncbi:6560_t:CDS:2 [Diversispora eburnea]|uniref:6560_t:CDS:1 n=1 Tax=Diversispora eburnea TaxID=1213867 RepID=A0A9N9BX75_9GLOM|nr:6560_t:CDS:2 [Diversispora eburnea]